MFKITGKFAPIVFRDLRTRGVNTLASNAFLEIASKNLRWTAPKDLPPYSSLLYETKDYSVKLGNFPEENLYVLCKDGKEVYRFDAWPENWTTPTVSNSPTPKQ